MFFALIFSLLIYIGIPVIFIIFVYQIIKRFERRADERLQLEKDKVSNHQQQMILIEEMNQRLANIERMLKSVE